MKYVFPLISPAKSWGLASTETLVGDNYPSILMMSYSKILQIFADMEELGVRPDGSIIRMLGDVFQKLEMMDKYEKLKKKYPPPKWEYRYIKGKRIRMRVYPDNKTEEATKGDPDTDELEEVESMHLNNELEEATSSGPDRSVLDDVASGDLGYI
jgi:hypothetical protein